MGSSGMTKHELLIFLYSTDNEGPIQLKSGKRLSTHRDVVDFRGENAEQEKSSKYLRPGNKHWNDELDNQGPF